MFYPVESHRTISENQKSVSVIFVKLDSDKKNANYGHTWRKLADFLRDCKRCKC